MQTSRQTIYVWTKLTDEGYSRGLLWHLHSVGKLISKRNHKTATKIAFGKQSMKLRGNQLINLPAATLLLIIENLTIFTSNWLLIIILLAQQKVIIDLTYLAVSVKLERLSRTLSTLSPIIIGKKYPVASWYWGQYNLCGTCVWQSSKINLIVRSYLRLCVKGHVCSPGVIWFLSKPC